MTAAPAGAGIRAPVRPQQAITVAISLAAAPLLGGQALEESAVPTHAIVWASLALASYAAGLLCLVGARHGGVRLASWKFGYWILLWYGAPEPLNKNIGMHSSNPILPFAFELC